MKQRKPSASQKVAVFLLGVGLGFAAMTYGSSAVMQVWRANAEPDLATQTLEQSVAADKANSGVAITTDVTCSRSGEYGVWICGYGTANGHSRVRVRWFEDGSFRYVGGFGQE